ncbi:FAD binding domain-containing protein [Hoeflea alexandrii]|uniref:FAD binding domain-containing protein n=1 Tax=Hoeflea alexandrii TaxID=288436 RepID=UPI00361B91DD
MKPAPFDYLRAATVQEAQAALAAEGEGARIIAGGQSLVAMLNMRLARPTLLVDVMHVPGGATMGIERGQLVVPFAVSQAALLQRQDLLSEVPLLAAALPWVGHVQTRARGTVCGSVAHADPSAEIGLALVALDGTVHLRGRRARSLPAAKFFTGMMQTAARPDEIIESVSFPIARKGTGHAFNEVGIRHGDFAIVSIAAISTGDRLRLAVGGVNDAPLVRDWASLDEQDVDDALNDLAWSLDARDDLHATSRYRRDLVRRLGRKTIKEARQCAD